MASEDFIPVAGDDWYQRRRRDAEGDFFRQVSRLADPSAGPDSSRQGIYCLTASGRLLAYKNHQDPDVMREVLEQGLRAWDRLPAGERTPGAIRVGESGRVDERFVREPPKDGLILNVFTRILDRKVGGRLVRGSCSFPGGEQAARDHLWLTAEDCRALMPSDPKVGDRFAMPGALADRLVRYHLVDNTRGEPDFWDRAAVRKVRLEWTVERVGAGFVQLRLEGEVLLANGPDARQARRGFDVEVLGRLRYDRSKKEIYRLELLAVGDHWGRGPYTPGERPGRRPLGIAMELADPGRAADRVPPQAARDWGDYLSPQR
jgi:hypothetical protein